jgi:hypothetical protein
MIRALLERKKSQTRRVVKPKPIPEITQIIEAPHAWLTYIKAKYGQEGELQCPYGNPGDRLWVRETFVDCGGYYRYYATDDVSSLRKKKPSIFMPRSASRITLAITEIRVQRLQEISEADARAEGVREVTKDGNVKKYCVYDQSRDTSSIPWAEMPRTAVEAYRILWDKINRKRGFGWDTNPWVWAITFKGVK